MINHVMLDERSTSVSQLKCYISLGYKTAIDKSNRTSIDVIVEASTSFSPLFNKRYFTFTVDYNEIKLRLFPTED